jgi:hypothetical protein
MSRNRAVLSNSPCRFSGKNYANVIDSRLELAEPEQTPDICPEAGW